MEFLDEARYLVPEQRLVIILDEFDELPPGLYQRTSVGESFFLSLRSIASKAGVGCVLVGGERMRFVLSRQGAKLNKWLTLNVDCFRRDTEWRDFCDLVERPVAGMLDFTPSAVARLMTTRPAIRILQS